MVEDPYTIPEHFIRWKEMAHKAERIVSYKRQRYKVSFQDREWISNNGYNGESDEENLYNLEI